MKRDMRVYIEDMLGLRSKVLKVREDLEADNS